jgi:hypothetical protein
MQYWQPKVYLPTLDLFFINDIYIFHIRNIRISDHLFLYEYEKSWPRQVVTILCNFEAC